MQQLYMPRHNRALRLCSRQPIKKDTLQMKLGNAFILLDVDGHFEEAIGFSNVTLQGRIAAADHNPIICLFDDLEMIGDFGADFVG
jgi:hypothetical protein